MPSDITDDVTFGDGQLDLSYVLQFGVVLSWTKTFIELDAGYRVRFNSPGRQAIGEAKLGQLLGRHVLLLAGIESALTVFEGEVIGQSFIATDPSLPASAFTLQNIRVEPLRVDSSHATVYGGVLLRFAGREWVLRVEHVVYGENYARVTGVSLAFLQAFGGGAQ